MKRQAGVLRLSEQPIELRRVIEALLAQKRTPAATTSASAQGSNRVTTTTDHRPAS